MESRRLMEKNPEGESTEATLVDADDARKGQQTEAGNNETCSKKDNLPEIEMENRIVRKEDSIAKELDESSVAKQVKDRDKAMSSNEDMSESKEKTEMESSIKNVDTLSKPADSEVIEGIEKLEEDKRESECSDVEIVETEAAIGNSQVDSSTTRIHSSPINDHSCKDDTDNNNATSRTETLKTPDLDFMRISPEIFSMIHMSPTQLYGQDHLIGLPRLGPRHLSRQSRPASTLNTPDPGYIDDLESDISSSVTDFNLKKGSKRKLDACFEQEMSENPLPNYSKPTSLHSSSFNRFPHQAEDSCMHVSSLSSTVQQNSDSVSTQQPSLARAQPCYQYDENANKKYCGFTGEHQGVPYRLDFRSPMELNSTRDFTSFASFDPNGNINKASTSQLRLPSFVSGQPSFPQGIPKPVPVFPAGSVAPRFDAASQVSMKYNLWQAPMQLSPCNFMPVNTSVFTPLPAARPTDPYYLQQQNPYINQHAFHVYSPQETATAQWMISQHHTLQGDPSKSSNCVNLNLTQGTENTNVPATAKVAVPQTTSVHSLNHQPGKGVEEIDQVSSTRDAENNNVSETVASVPDSTQDTDSDGDINVVILDENNILVKDTEKSLAHRDSERFTVDINANFTTSRSNDGRSMCVGDNLNEAHRANCREESSNLSHFQNQTDSTASEEVVTWQTKKAKVPLNIKNKEVMVPISDLGNKTVKQLINSAHHKESGDGVSRSDSGNGSTRIRDSFIRRFQEEQRTKSPISAFCAALEKPVKVNRPIIPAEPRIPIPALLAPNEVPMMYSGSMLVPYFNQAIMAQASGLSAAGSFGTSTTDVRGDPRLQAPAVSGQLSCRTLTSPHVLGQVPFAPQMAVPLYANPVYPSVSTNSLTSSLPVPQIQGSLSVNCNIAPINLSKKAKGTQITTGGEPIYT